MGIGKRASGIGVHALGDVNCILAFKVLVVLCPVQVKVPVQAAWTSLFVPDVCMLDHIWISNGKYNAQVHGQSPGNELLL